MDYSVIELVVLALAVGIGALVQGTIGFGLSLIAVPVMGLVEPSALPATMLLVSLPLTVVMAVRERHHIDRAGVWQIVLGRLPGTVAAVWVLSLISGPQIAILIGAAVIVATILSVIVPEFEAGSNLRLLAGVMSGFMGTIAAIGGPPLALAYQRRPGPELRSTLAASFVIGSSVSVVALAVTGHVGTRHVILACLLLPPLIAGVLLATRLHRFLDKGWLRPAVLTFAAISGVVAIVRPL
jgi:uncharacterized protein